MYVTATTSSGESLTAWPGGISRPAVTHVRVPSGLKSAANTVTVGLNTTTGVLSIYSFGSVHVVFSVIGFYAPSAAGSILKAETNTTSSTSHANLPHVAWVVSLIVIGTVLVAVALVIVVVLVVMRRRASTDSSSLSYQAFEAE